MRLQRTVTTDQPPERVFAYLSDFTTTTEWDPGTVRTTKVAGDGGVGTEYHNVSRFAGRETELTYVVEELVPDRRIVLRGANRTVRARDAMELRRHGDGTEVTYTADFEFRGLVRLAAPLFRPALERLGDEAERGMRDALARL